MRAGIVTINGLYNYGNRLQNYAVTAYLKKLNVDAKTLISQPMSFRWAMTEEELQYSKDKSSVSFTPAQLKRYNFKLFNEDYIPYDLIKKRKFDKEVEKKYDKFVTGSDQVFNPLFRSSLGQMDNNFLMFSPPEKKVPFAPSIGMDSIPGKWTELFYHALTTFPMISVREQSGANLIEKITGRRAKVVIDPTLMIDRLSWETIAKPLDGFDYSKPYILYYFLGDKDVEMPIDLKALLNSEKSKKGYRDVVLNDPLDESAASAGPSEFLDLFMNASLIVTDSFHGAVFSLIFEKPFVTVKRILRQGNENIDMSGRLNTLLTSLGLEDKLPKDEGFTTESIFATNYNECYGKLRLLQNEHEAFLKKALGIK
jgi:hypothetical protein